MKRNILILTVALMIFVCFSVSTFLSIESVSKLGKENNREKSAIMAEEIQNEIANLFSEAEAVSKTMNNSLVRDRIDNLEKYSEGELSGVFGKYLLDIKEKFDYATAFMVVDKSMNYYTEWGRIKQIDIDNPDDDWYENFRSSGKQVELNIDNDQANDNRITVYTNFRMQDEMGNFIGACGVGVTLDGLNLLINKLENDYGITAKLISESGVVQVSSEEGELLKPAAESDILLVEGLANSFKTTVDRTDSNGYWIAQYVPECDWYLIIGFPNSSDEYSKVLQRNLVAFIIALVIIIAVISTVIKVDDIKASEIKTDSETDKMTGLLNRRAYEEQIDRITREKREEELTVYIVDVNGLKKANDERGHLAGDELIKGAADCVMSVFGPHGYAYRIGGDEIAILMLEPVDDIVELTNRFKKEVASWHGKLNDSLAVAAGGVRGEDYPGNKVSELIEFADELMYKDKEEFYRDKRNDRRAAR